MDYYNNVELSKKVEEQVELLFKQNRLKTFKKWMFDDNAKCSAENMAEAGFVFMGTETDDDSVKCFLCEKLLDCWDGDDDPWQEHLKHSPICSFAKLQKAEDTLTLGELMDLRMELILSTAQRFLENEQNNTNYVLDDLMCTLSAMK